MVCQRKGCEKKKKDEKRRRETRHLCESLDEIRGRLEQKVIVRHRRLLVRLLVHVRLTRGLLLEHLAGKHGAVRVNG